MLQFHHQRVGTCICVNVRATSKHDQVKKKKYTAKCLATKENIQYCYITKKDMASVGLSAALKLVWKKNCISSQTGQLIQRTFHMLPSHHAAILTCWVALPAANECRNSHAANLTHEWRFAPFVLSKSSKKLWRWVGGSSSCLVFTMRS